MKKQTKVIINEFTPIRSLLYYAVNEYVRYEDRYLRIMVKDAINMANNADNRYNVNRRLYRYSHYLSVNSIEIVRQMDPDHLNLEDYKRLLEIFEKL